MSLFYMGAGANHFFNPAIYEHIMPDWLPWPAELVFFSGVAEVLLGAMLLVPRYRRWAAWGIIALLIAVFPANVNMYQHPELLPNLPEEMLLMRLPVQALFIYWAYTQTKP